MIEVATDAYHCYRRALYVDLGLPICISRVYLASVKVLSSMLRSMCTFNTRSLPSETGQRTSQRCIFNHEFARLD